MHSTKGWILRQGTSLFSACNSLHRVLSAVSRSYQREPKELTRATKSPRALYAKTPGGCHQSASRVAKETTRGTPPPCWISSLNIPLQLYIWTYSTPQQGHTITSPKSQRLQRTRANDSSKPPLSTTKLSLIASKAPKPLWTPAVDNNAILVG